MSDEQRWIFITRYEDLSVITGQCVTCSSVYRAALSAQLTIIVKAFEETLVFR